MKKFFLIIALQSLSAYAQDVEKLTSLQTRDGKEFFDVKITGKDNVGIKISHRNGVSRVAYEMLNDSLQKKFQYDPTKASEQKEKEMRLEALHLQQIEKQKIQAKVTDTNTSTSLAEPTSDETSIPLEKIPDNASLTKMEMYLSDLKIGIASAEIKIAALRKQAESDRKEMKFRTSTNINGYSSFSITQDRTAQARADKKEREAIKLTAQVSQAKILLESATQKYDRMKEQVKSP